MTVKKQPYVQQIITKVPGKPDKVVENKHETTLSVACDFCEYEEVGANHCSYDGEVEWKADEGPNVLPERGYRRLYGETATTVTYEESEHIPDCDKNFERVELHCCPKCFMEVIVPLAKRPPTVVTDT